MVIASAGSDNMMVVAIESAGSAEKRRSASTAATASASHGAISPRGKRSIGGALARARRTRDRHNR